MKETLLKITVVRKIYLILIICTLGIPFNLFAQNGGVSIGKGGDDAELSAILELVSKTKGFLAPRMNSTEREAIVAPADGLLVYDSTEGCYFCYSSGKWSHIGDIQMNIGTTYPINAKEGDFSFNPETRLLYVRASASWEQVGSKKPELKLDGSVLSVREQDSENSSSVNLAEWIDDYIDAIRAEMNSNSASFEAAINSLKTKMKADNITTRNLIENNTTNIATNTSAIADNAKAIKDEASQIRAEMNSNSASTEAAINSLKIKQEADNTVARNLIEINTTNIATNTSAIADLQNEKLSKTAAFNGDVIGTYNATVIANDAINSAKIANGTIVAADLNQMSATDGQVLSWNSSKSTWEAVSVAARSYTQKFEEDDSVPTTHSLAKTAIVNDASNSCSVTLNGETLDPTSYTFTTSTLKLLVPVYAYDKVTVTYCY